MCLLQDAHRQHRTLVGGGGGDSRGSVSMEPREIYLESRRVHLTRIMKW
jgi:hypothetical protein